MSDQPAPGPTRPGARARFRGWRRTRPFWGGVFSIVGGLELYLVTRASLALVVMQGLPGLATLTISVLAVILGVVTWVQPHLRTVTGWIIIVMGLISILVSNLGGFLIGMILMVIGGSLILAWQPPQFDDEYEDDEYYDEYDDDAPYEENPSHDDPQRSEVAEAERPGLMKAEASGSRRRTGPIALAGTFIKRHGFAGIKGLVKGNPRRTAPKNPRTEGDRGNGPSPALRSRRIVGAHGPSLRSVTAAVVPLTLLTLGGQLVVAGPAHAATGTAVVAAAPDWWPFDWWPGDGEEPPPAEPGSPAEPQPTQPANPEVPQQGGEIPPGVTLPPATPPNSTPEEQAAAEEEAQRIADENCKIENYPDALPALGSGNAKIAAAALNACITSQVRADNVPKPASSKLTVSSTVSPMKASLLEMSGFAYEGVQTLNTRNGKVRVLAFTADKLNVGGYDQTYTFPGGAVRNVERGENVTISGKVKLYVTSMSGKAFGLVPLTFNVDQPPPLVLPYLLFTDTLSQVVLVESEKITLPNLTITAHSN